MGWVRGAAVGIGLRVGFGLEVIVGVRARFPAMSRTKGVAAPPWAAAPRARVRVGRRPPPSGARAAHPAAARSSDYVGPRRRCRARRTGHGLLRQPRNDRARAAPSCATRADGSALAPRRPRKRPRAASLRAAGAGRGGPCAATRSAEGGAAAHLPRGTCVLRQRRRSCRAAAGRWHVGRDRPGSARSAMACGSPRGMETPPGPQCSMRPVPALRQRLASAAEGSNGPRRSGWRVL